MQLHDRVIPDKCSDIADSSKCAAWASNGECVVNLGWMSVNCRRACNLCTLSIKRDLGKTHYIIKQL